MLHTPFASALCALFLVGASPGCTLSTDAEAELGSLSLGLTTQAGGTTYRLTQARFALDGPEQRGFASGDQDRVSLELPAGSYSLELLEGWSLVQADEPEGSSVAATLVSENPTPVLVEADATTQVTLRFELADGTLLSNGQGTLQVDLELGNGTLGESAAPGCLTGLRINELDYDQPGSDGAEFIEILNAASCEAHLAGVVLELVNGGDNKVYARYVLSMAAETLPSGARLVLATPALLETLPAEVARLALNGNGVQNGPDGVRLLAGTQLLDALAYEGTLAEAGEGAPGGADEGEGALGRCPDGFDSNDNALDFRLLTPTPGRPNACEQSKAVDG